MKTKAHPCFFSARVGFFYVGVCLLLCGCNINTDSITPQTVGAAIVRSMCRAQNNCDVHDAR